MGNAEAEPPADGAQDTARFADYTAILAHELINPLAAIRGFTEMLIDEDLAREERLYALRTIKRDTDTLINLVADVRTAAAIDRGTFNVRLHPTAIAALLAEAPPYVASLPGDHPLVMPPSGDAMVLADLERIRQVLRCLLSNAARFSAPRTSIELRTTVEQGRVRIAVADRGKGIAPVDLPRIFEKFARGRDQQGRKGPGLGLGLFVARHLVQAHGSDLTVESWPGQGSVFAFTLEVAR